MTRRGALPAASWATRIRDVQQGPDGLLYVVTDEGDGRVLRVVPKG